MVLSGTNSNYSIIESGVPQGSVHGLLYPIYINIPERNMKSNINYFAAVAQWLRASNIFRQLC